MNLENNEDIKFKALESSHYCPPYKSDTFIEKFILEEFDVDKAKELVRDSVLLLSHSKNYRHLIIEILDVLDGNKGDFLTDQHKYISFYWSGIPVLQYEINKGVTHDRQLHISLQQYKSVKADRITDKKNTRIITAGVIGTLILGGIIAGLALVKKE